MHCVEFSNDTLVLDVFLITSDVNTAEYIMSDTYVRVVYGLSWYHTTDVFVVHCFNLIGN